jgi:hypothetical protein
MVGTGGEVAREGIDTYKKKDVNCPRLNKFSHAQA